MPPLKPKSPLPSMKQLKDAEQAVSKLGKGEFQPIPDSSLASRLSAARDKRTTAPLWEGPCGTGWNGGVTQSIVKAWLTDRERFRVKYIEGWRPTAKFQPRMDYGNLWHTCEEHFAANRDWEGPLLYFCRDLSKKYPFQREDINHWFEVCRTQFPLYVEWWSQHPEVVERTPLLQEYAFDVPYTLPSGKVVRLRGKFDAVDLVGAGKTAGIYLFETKTKGDIDEIDIQRNLTWDLQTMMYLTVLNILQTSRNNLGFRVGFELGPIRGVRYNVIRRPFSGDRTMIYRRKAKFKAAVLSKRDGRVLHPEVDEPGETEKEFYSRLGEKIRNAVGQEFEVGPDENYFFRRFKVEVTSEDVARFRRECLDPILQAIYHWYSYISEDLQLTGGQLGESGDVIGRALHWRHPFGAANSVDLYGASDVDNYVNTGSTIGLERSTKLFSELET